MGKTTEGRPDLIEFYKRRFELNRVELTRAMGRVLAESRASASVEEKTIWSRLTSRFRQYLRGRKR